MRDFHGSFFAIGGFFPGDTVRVKVESRGTTPPSQGGFWRARFADFPHPESTAAAKRNTKGQKITVQKEQNGVRDQVLALQIWTPDQVI